jgi:mono/diheme cytochrome c family protein
MRPAIHAAGLFFLIIGAASPASAADGKALYEANCAKCHGANGAADTPVAKAMKVPSLRDPRLAGEGGAALVTQAIRSNPKHQPVSGALDDASLAAVAEYVRTLAAAP